MPLFGLTKFLQSTPVAVLKHRNHILSGHAVQSRTMRAANLERLPLE
jgi:hypothetical protein